MKNILKKEIVAPLLILLITFIIYSLLKIIIKKAFNLKIRNTDSKRQKTIMVLFLNIIKIFLIIIATMMILDIYGIDIKSLLASLGVFAAVAALALQDILKDFVSGISIILEGQYRIGDIISINGFKGEVIFLSLKTTKIKAYTGDIKIFANHNVNDVINHSINDSLAIVDIAVAYESDLNKVEKVLTSMCKELSTKLPFLKGELTLLGVQELGDSAITYRITCLTEATKQYDVQRLMLKEIKMELDKNKIDIPYPQMVIHNG